MRTARRAAVPLGSPEVAHICPENRPCPVPVRRSRDGARRARSDLPVRARRQTAAGPGDPADSPGVVPGDVPGYAVGVRADVGYRYRLPDIRDRERRAAPRQTQVAGRSPSMYARTSLL